MAGSERPAAALRRGTRLGHRAPTAAPSWSSAAPPATTPTVARASAGSSTRPTRSRSGPKLRELADDLRRRWPELGRIALLHRSRRGAAGRVGRGRRGVGAPSGRGVRRGPVRHRHAQGDGADLEARDLGRRSELGSRAQHLATCDESSTSESTCEQRRVPPDRRRGQRRSARCCCGRFNRKPTTFMSSIDDFSREMKALGHEDEAPQARRRPHAVGCARRGGTLLWTGD